MAPRDPRRRTELNASAWFARTGAALVAGALAFLVPVTSTAAQTLSVQMAAKNFSGAQVLSQAYGQALASRGAHVTFSDAVGPTEVVFPALRARHLRRVRRLPGHVAHLPRRQTDVQQRQDAHRARRQAARHRPHRDRRRAPVDVNGFFVTRRTARKLHLSKVSDLRRVAPRLTIGAPPECASRPLCLGDASQRTYGLRFGNVVPIDPNGPATERALSHGDIDVAVLFTGSSVIPRDAVLLRDDKGLQPADNPVLVVRESMATPETLRVANKVSAAITTGVYNAMSLAVSRDERDPTEVAARFLAEHSLP